MAVCPGNTSCQVLTVVYCDPEYTRPLLQRRKNLVLGEAGREHAYRTEEDSNYHLEKMYFSEHYSYLFMLVYIKAYVCIDTLFITTHKHSMYIGETFIYEFFIYSVYTYSKAIHYTYNYPLLNKQ